MADRDNFASLMEASLASGTSRAKRRLRAGEAVEGVVIQVTADSVFVDVGTPADARIPRSELEDPAGELHVKVGDRVSAIVNDVRGEAPLLSVSIGRGGNADLSSLEMALSSGAPASGRVSAVIKGGLEIEIGQLRAFCPASLVDTTHVADLNVFLGQTFEFRVLEIRDRGRSIVVSRRALLEEQRRQRERDLLERLKPGIDLDGVVHSVQRHGATVDLNGVEGFVHISELAAHRVERSEDVVKVGDPVRVRVLAIEQSPKGLRIKLSMKALQQAAPPDQRPAPEEVLKGTVTRANSFGVFVQTAKGEGLVPVRELALPPGADHRRAFPQGREIEVVLLSRDAASGKLRFSMAGVAGVQERMNYREFAKSSGAVEAPRSLGSLGDLFREKLGVQASPPRTPATSPASSSTNVIHRRR